MSLEQQLPNDAEELPTFNYAIGGGSFTGKFQISLQEIEKGYRCGTITHKDGAVFMGKYWENKDTGITKMVEGTYTYKCGTQKFWGKFWENSGNDGMLVFG